MAETSGMAEIRGIDINKVATAFADEELVLKKYCNVTKTNARELRWWKKTAGFLDSTDTSGITASQAFTDQLALPVVIEQSWTRVTSHVRKYFFESPWLSEEDVQGCDIDVLGTNIEDVTKAVANQVDTRIYTVLHDTYGAGGNVNTSAAAGTGWDDATNGNPILDILSGKASIRTYRYNPEGAIIYMHPTEEKMLLNWLITTKGSSIPQYSSVLAKDNKAVLEICGCNVVVSVNATTDYMLMFVPKKACRWKQFMPITSAVKHEEGIGYKIRVWEQGEALLENPRAVFVLTDTTT